MSTAITINKNLNCAHATIFVESKLCDLREKLEMFKKHLNVTDENCFIEINGNNSTIKKEEILDIIQRFQLSSFHGSPKLYVIKGIENSSAQAINALLKFLEEPPINTYAILTTKNINVVLQTIKSRCQIVILKSNFKKLDELINKFNLTDEQINVIKNVYYDWDTLLDDIENKTFFDYFEIAKQIIKSYDDLVFIKKIADDFKKMSYKQITLLLKFIHSLKPTIELLNLIDSLNVSPARLLIFNHLWNILSIK